LATRWIELSQPWFEGMPRCPGHDPVRFWTVKKPKALEHMLSESSVTHFELAAHVGTHVDAARHFIAGATTIDQYPLERFIGPAVVWDVRREGPVPLTAAELAEARPEVRPGDSVLLYFGYAERFREPSYHEHPYLTADAADWLVERRINLLGTDTVSPDYPIPLQPAGFLWPAHGRLLGHDILIVENLGPGLAQVLGRRVTFIGAPMRIEGSEGSPLAALAMVEE